MNEIPLDKDEDEIVCTTSNFLISSPEEVEDLATDLADGFSNYLNVDTRLEEQQLKKLIDESLEHLVGVLEAWDRFKDNPSTPAETVNKIILKNESMQKLYKQIDSLEQFIQQTNQNLDRLESALREIESKRPIKNKLRQIIEILPKFSIGIPRFGL